MGQAASISIQRRVEWSDTDASGHHHNTAVFRMLEFAETALYDSLGILDDIYHRLPRVHIEADFTALLGHRDLVDIGLTVTGMGASSLTHSVTITRDGEVCATARVTVVLLGDDSRPARWPEEYRRLLLGGGEQPGETLLS